MEVKIRDAVLKNLASSSKEDIYDAINEIVNKDEVGLPGLGVMMELYWSAINQNERYKIAETILTQI